VVGKVGTAVVHTTDLSAALRRSVDPTGGKLLDWKAAAERVERWRARGLTVGFTNGCFDLLHPGHVSLLNEARSHCDRLVVALNTDASVRRLKGESRPIQDEQARSSVIAALASVDIFQAHLTAARAQLCPPDIHIKPRVQDAPIDAFDNCDPFIEEGYRATMEIRADIERALGG